MRDERAALAEFGRWKLLGSDLSGEPEDFSYWYDRLTFWLEPLLAGGPAADRATQLLNDLATEYGGWTAIGAWKVLMEFGSDGLDQLAEVGEPALAACVRAYDGFGITNLAIHVSVPEATAFADVLGRPAPMDGFFGPPVFTTTEGPQKSFFLDAAADLARQRSPARLVHAPGVEPDDLGGLSMDRLFDLGRLLLMGPLLVAPEASYEPALVAPYRRVADGVDHVQVQAQLRQACEGLIGPSMHPRWAAVGAARFVEDYLTVSLTASTDHLALIDLGLDFLAETRVLDGNCSAESFSETERQRLHERFGMVGSE